MPRHRPVCLTCSNQRGKDEYTARGNGTPAEIRTALGRLEEIPKRGETVLVRDPETGDTAWVCPYCTPAGEAGTPLVWMAPNRRARRAMGVKLVVASGEETDDARPAA